MNRPLLLGAGLLGLGALALAAASTTPPARALGAAMHGHVGRFFSWIELTASATARRLGLDNTPPPEVQARLADLVSHVLDPLRLALGRRVRITSGYRSPEVNRAVHGSATSQHMLGEAADIKVEGDSAEALATVIVRLGLPVDQVIWYAPERGGHVHVSFTTRRANRGQALHAPAEGGYLAWAPRLAA